MSAWWCVRHGWTAGVCVTACDRRLIGPFAAIETPQTATKEQPR